MTKRDVLSVAFKIIGAYFLTVAAIAIPQIGIGISSIFNTKSVVGMNPYALAIATIISPILWVIFAYIFIKFSDLFSQKLIPLDSTIPEVNPIQYDKPIFILALRIIGVVSLTRGIPSAIKFLVQLSRWQYENVPSYALGDLASAIALILLGIYLVIGGKKLVEFAYQEKATTNSNEDESNLSE